MSMVTRYTLRSAWGEMDEAEYGEWCQYEDHISEVKALQEEIALLKSKLNFDWDSIK